MGFLQKPYLYQEKIHHKLRHRRWLGGISLHGCGSMVTRATPFPASPVDTVLQKWIPWMSSSPMISDKHSNIQNFKIICSWNVCFRWREYFRTISHSFEFTWYITLSCIGLSLPNQRWLHMRFQQCFKRLPISRAMAPSFSTWGRMILFGGGIRWFLLGVPHVTSPYISGCWPLSSR